MQSESQGVLSVQIAFLIFVVTVKRTQLGLTNVFSQSQDRLRQNKRIGVRSSAVKFATHCDWSADKGSPILLF